MRNTLLVLYTFILIIFMGCRTTRLVYRDDADEESLSLIVINKNNEDKLIPKFYIEIISNGIANNPFEIISDTGERAWFHGAFYSAQIPEYTDAPERYAILKKNEPLVIPVSFLGNSYIFENNYNYMYIRYIGYLGISNKIRVRKKIIPIANAQGTE